MAALTNPCKAHVTMGKRREDRDNLNFPAQESLSFLLSTLPFPSGCKVKAIAIKLDKILLRKFQGKT